MPDLRPPDTGLLTDMTSVRAAAQEVCSSKISQEPLFGAARGDPVREFLKAAQEMKTAIMIPMILFRCQGLEILWSMNSSSD